MMEIIISEIDSGVTTYQKRNFGTGEVVSGHELVMLDRRTEVIVRAQFAGDSLKTFIGNALSALLAADDLKEMLVEVIAGLTDPQKRELVSLFGDAPTEPEEGPQG